MLSKILFSIFIISIAIPMLAAAQDSSPLDLVDYKWENRLLLVFAPTQQSDLYQGQMQELKGKEEGLNDRDMKIFHLVASGASHVGEKSIGKKEVQQMHNDFKVGTEEFTVILIGKDGTEKLRTDSVLTTDKLFAVIDAMPMRRQEMNQ